MLTSCAKEAPQLRIDNVNLRETDVPPVLAKDHYCPRITLEGVEPWQAFARTLAPDTEDPELRRRATQHLRNYFEKKMLPARLSDLRECLYFEQKRWPQYSEATCHVMMGYIRALLHAIRLHVRSGDVD